MLNNKIVKIALNDAKEMKIITKDSHIIKTKILYFFKDNSDTIKEIYKSEDPVWTINENYVIVVRYLKFIEEESSNIFYNNNVISINIIKALKFYHHYGLHDFYNLLCVKTRSYDENIIMKIVFAIVEFNLPKHEVYDEGIKLMRKSIVKESDSYKIALDFAKKNYLESTLNKVFADICII